MPELPDVQVFKEYLDATSLHQEVASVHLLDAEELLKGVSASTLRRHLEGHSFQKTQRHGKHLFIELQRGDEKDGWLHLHFGMTGGLKYFRTEPRESPEAGEERNPVKLQVDFANGSLLQYLNTRRLGALGWIEDVESFLRKKDLGPDAMEISREGFRDLLANRRVSIKATLMNQELMAGVGNVYADEILFQAGIHPQTKPGDLGQETADEIHGTMRSVLQKAIRNRVEDFPADFLLPSREEGAPCPRCSGRIEKLEVSGRPTFFCPSHQRKT